MEYYAAFFALVRNLRKVLLNFNEGSQVRWIVHGGTNAYNTRQRWVTFNEMRNAPDPPKTSGKRPIRLVSDINICKKHSQ